MNVFQLASCAAGLLKDGVKQSAFIKSFLKPLVQKHCNRLGYQLTASEQKKVLFYYPMYTILACAEMYLALKGRGLHKDDKPTGAVVGQQPFGGARASGTNDKAGSMLNLYRWLSARTIKETFNPPVSIDYPFMQES